MEDIKPEEAVAFLKKKGIEVSVDQAAAILEFMNLLANILVTQYLKDK